MRGTVRRARPAVAVDLRAFGWDRALIATLRHSTLPWFDGFAADISLDATPIAEAGELGARDRLSLVAQLAAHQALLQFAGFSDADYDPAEWAIVRKRGNDCRLVRVVARGIAEEAPPALTVIQQFAEGAGAPPLESLRQSWGRAESVYLEIESRLRGDAAADLRWMRRAACGGIASPGPDALNDILRGAARSFRGEAIDAIRAAAALGGEQVIEIGLDASPLQRYSAVNALAAIAGSLEKRGESEIVEAIVERAPRQRLIFAITNRDRFDAASARVLEMLAATDAGIWIAADRGDVDLPAARSFIVAASLRAARAVEGRAQLDAFVESDDFPLFLDSGTLPFDEEVPALVSLREPLRSYIAAIALLGTRARLDVAAAFFRQLMFGESVEGLVVDGITSIEDGHLLFASDAVRRAAARLIPPSSQATLGRVAAEVLAATGDFAASASLLIDAGDARAAAAMLERALPHKALPILRMMPRHALTPKLAEILASALIDAGRYRDARDAAQIVAGDAHELLLARIERRTGDYGPALTRLDRIAARGFDAAILRADLLYIDSRYDEMRAALAECTATNDEEHAQLAYLRALLAFELREPIDDQPEPSHYLASRLATYLASRDNVDAAARHAAQSLERARCETERIDAALDRVYILFTAGSWAAARDEALRTLALIEETQGDRAGGGILFILAYLAADDGQWTHAAQRLHRLRHFYRGTGDDKRLHELDMIAAHLDFSRGRFADAARAAQAIVDSAQFSPQIREAAALILDEIDWIGGRDTPLRSTGSSENIELTKRHNAMRVRRSGGLADLGGTNTGSQKLKHFRDALGRGDTATAESLAAEMKIELPKRETTASAIEMRFLREAALRDFPFTPRDFVPTTWRFATRNRLGQWQEIGSAAALTGSELDTIAAAGKHDWILCSDRELLFVDGISAWAPESRDALAALFRTRAEHRRMRRVIEQNENVTVAKSEAIEGIVGDSPVMREIFTLITRVARRDVPVCILGESGTGKELAARAVHRHSPRRGKIFTPVNCAALPENLIESELFGHVRGAFTGADRDRAGLIESSDGGTLFLDEIGEMPLSAQAKLLRFLQEGEFRRVGDTVNRTADVRIVSATNRKLESAVEDGQFREDLYYRIGGIEIALPPLRERPSDIPLLASHFIAREHEKSRGGPSKLTADAESVFIGYRWPGNVRELQNTIRAAHALAGEAAAIDVEHLPERMRSAIVRAGGGVSSYQDAVTRFRRDLIEKSLVQANGNQNRAAASLNMSRQALAYQIRELGILVRQ
ncbi:MAG TPA: sigma 54-interacting transcriptional regulator [Thermoanaerobaculia bacterium]|jgi:DNA-binding NtrC family response regulator|nr:sigma 54-interacting transcriptional regulator [Thermoanaerobaculia bacterium]